MATRIHDGDNSRLGGVVDSAEKEWDTYVERVELYLATNKITDEAQKRDVLLSVCGAKTYHILRNLLAPTKPTASTYVDIVSRLSAFQTEAGSSRETLPIQLSLSTTWRVRLQVRGRTAASSHRVRVRRLAQRDAASSTSVQVNHPRVYSDYYSPRQNLISIRHSRPRELHLIITMGNGPTLLGRNWLEMIHSDWKGVYQLRDAANLAVVLATHESDFKKELGTITCAKAKLHVNSNVPPSFHRPHLVPYAMKDKVDVALERLEKGGIIKLREFSKWASSIVAVTKKDSSVRICGDYKVSVNKAMVCDTHPILRRENSFAAMSGGVSFSKPDLSHAYPQLQLEESAKDYLVINTHKGLFEYTRLSASRRHPQFFSGLWTTCSKVSSMSVSI